MQKADFAIAMTDYSAATETFVRRHAECLFGGRTAVVVIDPIRDALPGRPVHHFRRATLAERGLGGAFGHAALPSLRRREEALHAFLRETGVGGVLCEFGYVATKLALPAARAGLPVYCYFRGADASKRLRGAPYLRALREVFPHLAGVIAVSRFLLDNLADAGLVHPNAVVIPSGTDTLALTPGPTEPAHLLSIGRFVPKKDYGTALAAFARVAPDHPGLRWTIVGSGPMEAAIRRQAAALGVAEQISFAGTLPHGEAMDLMRRATAYVQTFRTAPDGDTEGMPSAVQEAMAAGRAIVTTAHAGVPEHVTHGVTGLLAAEGDVVAVAANLAAVLEDPGLRDRLGAAARAHAERALDYRALYARAEAFLRGGTGGP